MNRLFFFYILFLGLFLCQPAYAKAQLDIEVDGVTGEIRDNVYAFLSLEREKTQETLSRERIDRLYKKGFDEIKKALQPFGYYKPNIKGVVDFNEDVWRVKYTIEPGPEMKIHSLDLKILGAGHEDSKFIDLEKNFPIKVGETLNHQKYSSAKKSLQQLAADRGYMDARFTKSEILVDLEKYHANIVLHYDTGPRYLFGPVTFKQDTFRDSFLERYIKFKEGDPYSLTRLLNLQNTLSDSNYFSQVEVHTRHDLAKDLKLPIEVKLTPKDRTKYTAGLGYGTDTGARASLGMERRWVTRDGHRLTADWKVSQIGNSVNTRYIIPLHNPSTDQFAVTAGREEERLPSSLSRKRLVGVSHTRLASGWQKTLSLSYEAEKFNIGGESGKSVLVMPGINWTRIKANNRIYTTFGHRFVIDFRGGSETLGSTTSFLQLRLGSKWIRRFQDFARVIGRIDAGTTKVLNFNQLPPSVRFLAGGDWSVRGYQYNSLGPKNDAGETIGGKDLLVVSGEYEQILSNRWSLAVFYDAGNAMDSFAKKLARGVGVGIRFRSPVGLFRLDFARGLDKDEGKPRYIHLSIGPDL